MNDLSNLNIYNHNAIENHTNVCRVANVANKDIHSKLLDDYEAKYNVS